MKYVFFVLITLFPFTARADSTVIFCIPNSPSAPAGSTASCTPVSTSHPLPVSSN